MSQLTVSSVNSSFDNTNQVVAMGAQLQAFSIHPLTLAHLDFGLFRTLSKLGTSKTRICAVLSLSATEFDYVEQLRLLSEGAV